MSQFAIDFDVIEKLGQASCMDQLYIQSNFSFSVTTN
jgi:hypothetical protein